MKRRNKRECRISSSIKRVRKESRKSSLNLSKIFVKNTKKAKKKILTNSYNYKTRKNSRNEKLNIKKVSIVAIIAIIAILIGIFGKSEKKTIISNPEILTMMGYEQVEDSDFKTQSDYVNFGAFFLRDLNNDGYAEKIAGTSKEIGQKDTLYFNIAVNTEGVLKNGKITIDGKNFNLATAIVKDSVIKNNYISKNTTEIELNDVNVGTTKLLMGIISNKTISSQADYSQINTVTLTGTYVGYGGAEIEINKTIDLMVDWHGNVATTIETSSASLYAEDIINADSNTVDVEFTITTKETKNQLILTKSYVEVTIPELNGYKPVDVKVIGNKLETTYSEETGIFAITRNGINLPKTNAYKLQVKYPLEAYESMTEDVVSIQIPVTANYTGLNNNSGEFENPKISENANKNVTIIIESIKPEIGGDDGNLNENGNLNAITIGKTIKTPIQQYVVSKEIPMKIYAGQDVTENTEYTVMWKNTSNNGLDKLELSQTKPDEFYNEIDGSYISGEEHISYKGIYFVNALQVLGENGTITVKNADTNKIIHKFTAEDFGKYTSSNPYKYDKIIKNIKIETSAVIDRATLYVYNIKEIDDENLTTTYTKNKLEELTKIYSYLDSTMTSGENVETQSISANANYKSSNSYAIIEIDGETLSTQDIEENKILTITTISDGYGTAKWINGEFIVKFPKEILEVEINNIISNNALVEILGYEVNETEEGLYLRIITENSIETTYEIYIDANIIADSRIATVGRKIELYYSNENCSNYINETINVSGQNITLNTEDIYDVNLNLDITEKVGYNQTLIDLVTPGSLTTAQIASEYDNTGDITIAPQTVEIEPEVIVDNEKQTAVITVQVMNNYTGTVSETTILGKIPFEGNLDKVGNSLRSTYTTHITSEGIQVPENLVGKVEVYYSENENPTKDVSDNNNGWVKNPTDLSKIKTFLIDFEEYVLEVEEEAEFTYEIEIPDNLNYNEISYSIHTVDFYLDTESGKLAQTIEPRKLGFRIAKKYDLELSKYRKGTTTLVPGMTFSVTTLNDDNEIVSQIRTTDENGILIMENLYVEKKYTLKEIKVQSGYELNTEEIKFIAHVNNAGVMSIEILSGEFLETPNIEIPEEGKPIIKVSLDNEVKYHLSISKLGENDSGLNAAKFILEGNSQKRTLITNSKGNISLKNLLIGEEYTLTETNADGYYVLQESMSFKIIRNTSGKLELITSNNLTGTIQENEEELNPTLNLTIRNEKIPTYSLKITKVEEQTNLDIETGTTSKEDKLIEGVQFELYSKDLETTEILTTDANGMLTISGLYEYVSGKYITGEYTLKEIYAPAGYAVNENVLKFRAERKNGNLVLTILEGQDLIADSNEAKFGVAYDSLNTEITTKEISIEKASTSNAIVNLRIENAPVFSLTKIDKETKLPLEGAKFAFYKVEYDENNNEVLSQVIDNEGNIFGTIETIEGVNTNVAVTNEYGSIIGNLAEGYYKAVEIEAPEGYLINELEKTTYFGIGSSKPAETIVEEKWSNQEFENNGDLDNLDLIKTEDGGYIVLAKLVGKITFDANQTAKGEAITINNSSNNAMVIIKYNSDNKIEYTTYKSQSGFNTNHKNEIKIKSDGKYIVSYTGLIYEYENDTFIQQLSYGGNTLYGIITTKDNGYIAIGNATNVKFSSDQTASGEEITLTATQGNDTFIVKYNNENKVEWSRLIGGVGHDYAPQIVELNNGYILKVNLNSSLIIPADYMADGQECSLDKTKGILKFDKNGKIINTYNDNKYVKWSDNAKISATYDDGYIIIDKTRIEKYTDLDEIEWTYVVTEKATLNINEIIQAEDGSYYAVGKYKDNINFSEQNTYNNKEIVISSNGGYDGIIIKWNTYGKIEWIKTIGSICDDTIDNIIEVKNGLYMVEGNILTECIINPEENIDNKEYSILGHILITYNDLGKIENIDHTTRIQQEYNDSSSSSNGGNVVVGFFYGVLNIPSELTTSGAPIKLISGGGCDGLIVKYDKNGKIEWANKIGGYSDDKFNAVITNDLGYLVVGEYKDNIKIEEEKVVDRNSIILSNDNSNSNGVILQYNNNGLIEWCKSIGATGSDSIKDISCNEVGEYIIYGTGANQIAFPPNEVYNNQALNLNLSGSNGFTIKYNSENKITSYNIVKNGIIPQDLEITEDGGYLLAGRISNSSKTLKIESDETVDGTEINKSYTDINGGAVLIKYDAQGKIEYAQCINDFIPHMSIINRYDGPILVARNVWNQSFIIPAEDTECGNDVQIIMKGYYLLILKYSIDGKFQWFKVLDDYAYQGRVRGKNLNSGGMLITGRTKIFKLDENANIEWENNINGDYTDITEVSTGEYILAGYITNNMNIASITKITETIISPEVPPKQNLEITNTKMSYKIKTKVATHTETDSNGNEIEVQGGTISGNGLGYYEEVKYKEDSTKDIIITPDEGYKVASITVNGQDFGFTLNEDGKTVLLSKFLEVIENKEVIVKFEKVETSVLVHHYLWDETNGLTTNRIADDEFISGKVGESYTTSPKVGLGNYELVTNANILGETTENPEDYYIPENAIGTFADEQTEVNYYYKEKTYKLTVHHYLDGTTDKLAEDEIIEKFVSGSEYATTKSSSIDRKYKVVLVVGNEAGIITEDTEVTYYYIDTSIDITANKVWQDTLGIARPDEITIALVGTNLTTNEQEYYEEQILSKENNWSYSWADLYVDTETGERINYKVLELTELEDYYLLGIEEKNNTFTITNRFKISLPNSGGSGIKNIILIGIFVVGIGVVLIRKNKIMVIIPQSKKTTRKARIARKK